MKVSYSYILFDEQMYGVASFLRKDVDAKNDAKESLTVDAKERRCERKCDK